MESIKARVAALGPIIAGFADLERLPERERGRFPRAVALAAAIEPRAVAAARQGPTEEFVRANRDAAALLREGEKVVRACLAELGHRALSELPKDAATQAPLLPQKTAATLAGLGWVGRCGLLATERYGTAVRLFVLLTDAPLPPDAPVTESRCGSCERCRRACPAGAISGRLWSPAMDPAGFFNAAACSAYRTSAATGLSGKHCAICINACPWTRRHLRAAGLSDDQ
jgi:epoxyqueuosine reductase QueG